MTGGARMDGEVIVQCSTAVAPLIGGGRFDDFDALLVGMRRLRWPQVELRLWDEWLGKQEIARVVEGGAQVGTVHAPPLEQLAGFAHERARALALLDASSHVAAQLGAASVVVHAWDLRAPGFSPGSMVETLQQFHELHPSAPIAVELIPGYTRMLPLLIEHCEFVRFVVDTQWASLEGNWSLLFDHASLVNNVHVQSFLDTDEQGDIRLGRGRFGAACDAAGVVRRLRAEGYSGWLTLEPVGVPEDGDGLIRDALILTRRWLT